MTTPYICASCRGLGAKAQSIRKLQWSCRASFISLNQPQRPVDGAATASERDERINLQRSSGRNRATNASNTRQQQWPLARLSRDEILESLFLSPRDEASIGAHRVRYPAARYRDSDAASGKGNLSFQPMSRGWRTDNSNLTEDTTFRRLYDTWRPLDITLRRLPVRQRQPTDNDQSAIDAEADDIKLTACGSTELRDSAVDTVIKRLGHAIERTDFTRAEALWGVITQLYPGGEVRSVAVDGANAGGSTTVPAGSGQAPTAEELSRRIPMRAYNMFLFTFMTLGRSDKAIHIWNHMVLSGQQPEQATWGAMLQGCKRARDPRSVEIIWAKMRAAGVNPDVQSWTIRIGALIHSGKWDMGLRALHEMGRIWLEAARAARSRGDSSSTNALTGDVAGVAKPTTTTVNVVMAALIKTRKRELAPKVLDWAKKIGIEPDITTFNTLLAPAVRGGRSEEASRLLQQMESLNIQPDVVTFTTILDGLFRDDSQSSSPQSAAAKEKAVAAVLAQMEESGVQANAVSYGIIIDNLLKSSTPNLPAARAVLDHMASQNIQPSPHIYTILLTHYFSQQPPDLAALDVLWNRIRLERGVVDDIFYDRMLEGYGKLGQSGKMMAFLRRMAKEGRTPGWEALIVVLKTLVRTEEWDVVGDLISDVERGDGLFQVGVRPWQGEAEFQQLVRDLRRKGLIKSSSAGTEIQEELEERVAY